MILNKARFLRLVDYQANKQKYSENPNVLRDPDTRKDYVLDLECIQGLINYKHYFYRSH